MYGEQTATSTAALARFVERVIWVGRYSTSTATSASFGVTFAGYRPAA